MQENYQHAGEKIKERKGTLQKVVAPRGGYSNWHEAASPEELQAAAQMRVADISKTLADDMKAAPKKTPKARSSIKPNLKPEEAQNINAINLEQNVRLGRSGGKPQEPPDMKKAVLPMFGDSGSRNSSQSSAGRSQSTAITGSGGSSSEITPANTPARQPRATLDSVREDYTVAPEAAPFMKDKYGMTPEEASKPLLL